MNNKEKDIYRKLFAKQTLEGPSMSFENSLMHRIRLNHIKQERQRNRMSILYMILGIVSIIILPAILLNIMGWSWSLVDLIGNPIAMFQYIRDLEISPLVVLACVSMLFLLLLDSLIRKHLNKKEKESHP